MYTPQVATGTITGTGSAITVNIGFKPNYVLIVNKTQSTRLEYTGSKTNKLTTTPTFAFNDNITVLENGFTLAAAENSASDAIEYVAIGV